jgi:hypothetical protein
MLPASAGSGSLDISIGYNVSELGNLIFTDFTGRELSQKKGLAGVLFEGCNRVCESWRGTSSSAWKLQGWSGFMAARQSKSL